MIRRFVFLALLFLSVSSAFAQRGQPWQPGSFRKWSLKHPPGVRGGAGGLPIETSEMFAGSGVCATCHEAEEGLPALMDAQGNDVSPPTDWRSTMMANSLRDPMFRAKIQAEIERHPNVPSAAIEDTCLTCHAPLARTQAIADGAEHYTLAEAMLDPLARDGVSCTLCHQIQPDNLGDPSSYDGHYLISQDERVIFGPYSENLMGQPMINVSGFTPMFGAHKQTSEVCATCHTLMVETLGPDGLPTGNVFPEQTPYLEWKNSLYAAGAAEESSCQNCHMPRTFDGVIISARPPFGLEARSPFWQHHFTGGNAFMLGILRDNAAALETTATTAQFDASIARTLDRLQNATVELDVVEATGGDTLSVVVSVENKAGHKFPTAYSSRRAWLRVTATDAKGATLFDSGAWNAAGQIVGPNLSPDAYEPHRDLISSETEVQIYEGVAGDSDGSVTHSLLAAAEFLKDNRLPPRGFLPDGPDIEFTAPKGAAASDANFNLDPVTGDPGTGRDLVTYMVPAAGATLPITVEVQMVYQSVSPVFVADLFESDQPLVNEFEAMYNAADNAPIVVGTVTRMIEASATPGGWVIR